MTAKIQPINKGLIIITLGVFLLLLIFIHSYRPIRTVSALEGSIEEFSSAYGFIIRQETLVNSPHDGWVLETLKEGTRVRKNDNVIKYSLEEIITKETVLEERHLTVGSSRQQINIDNKIYQLQDLNLKGNIFDARAIFNQIINIQETIDNIEPKPIDSKDNIKPLNLASPMPGTISYYKDGLEELLTVSSLKDLDVKLLKSLKPNGIELDTSILKADTPVYKVFDNLKWYMALIVAAEEDEFKKGQNIRIKIKEINDFVSATVEHYNLGEEMGVLILSCAIQIPHLDRLRNINVEIIKNIHRGIKIPIESIIYNNDIPGVIIKQRGQYVFKEIEIIAKDQENAIITGIRDFEEVVINPRWVKRLNWR